MYRLATCFWVSDCTHSTGFVGCALNERTFTGRIVASDNTETDDFDWSYMSGAKNITLTFEGEQ